MKNNIILAITITCLTLIYGCGDINDIHEMYMTEGEQNFIGAVDSAVVFGGKERIQLWYWASDLRATSLKVYWSQRQDSIDIDIPDRQVDEAISVIIGNDQLKLPEGAVTFELVTNSDKNARSILYEKVGNVYGSAYQTTLSNRRLVGATQSESNTVDLSWSALTSDQEVALELSYTDVNQNVVSKLFTYETDTFQYSLNNVDFSQPVTYRTAFVPELGAIDTFFTAPSQPIQILAKADRFTFDTSVDFFVKTANGDDNLASEVLEVKTTTDLNTRRTYMVVDFTSVKDNISVDDLVSVNLPVVFSHKEDLNAINVYIVDQVVDYSTTWNTQPAVNTWVFAGATPSQNFGVDTDANTLHKLISVDITEEVQTRLAEGNYEFSLVVVFSQVNNAFFRIASSRHSNTSLRPTIGVRGYL
ncbi:DUF4998 domain-containing protein [Reichenbachiella sp. MALMAid0571]|uniref:DUF4998 domain-containing protein n=1 Tax=Reichenbachiella sp. MALMAid0571 TaxID=3143939 RepID=UPI0032E049B6